MSGTSPSLQNPQASQSWVKMVGLYGLKELLPAVPGGSTAAVRVRPGPELKDSVKLRLAGGGRVPVLVGRLLRHVAPPPGRGQVLKHGGVVSGQHVLQV